MYGLSDASRGWFDYFGGILVRHGYKQCMNDPCAFVKREGEEFVITSVHVDDGTDISNSERLLQELHDILQQYFKITQQESLENQLGMHFVYNEDGSMTIRMPVQIRKVIEYVYESEIEIPLVTTPMTDKWDEEYQRGASKCDISKWLTILGMVVWIMRVRLDIAVAVSRLCAD